MTTNSREKDKLEIDWKSVQLEQAIDWNSVDPYDKEVWDRLVMNFWVPEKIPVSNDLPSWETLNEHEKEATNKVFTGLTLLDTIQGKVGAISLIPDAITPHEEAIYTNIAFMESIHAKSYSTIFSTLLSKTEIEEVFRWSRENEYLKKKAAIVLYHYRGDDPEKRKIASVLLESFLFYSGFFLPLWWSSKSKLTNTADIIKLIIRDESIHGVYIGDRFQRAYKKSSPERQSELKEFADDLLHDLYVNELDYTSYLYDEIGLTEKVNNFLRYNANKAFYNLGFEAPFASEDISVPPQVLAALNPGDESHDFFSGNGNTYVIGDHEETEDEDWDF